jgi:VIT1/CCC1 family predicted Fe2+/Mn2+ transporter
MATDSTEALDRVATQLRAAGSTEAESLGVTAAFDRNPEALLRYVVAFEVDVPRGAEASPVTHALWMFTADLLAASVPVVPFVLFDIETARVVSLVVTGGMMAVLGIARG